MGRAARREGRAALPNDPIAILTQVAFVARLAAILPVVIGLATLPDQARVVPAAFGCVIVGAIGFIGLMSRSARDFIRRHPSIVLADALILATLALTAGGSSPFTLTFMSSALVVGLLAAPWAGALILVSLIGLHVMVLVDPAASTVHDLLITPLVLLTLWALGMVVRRTSDAEARSRRALTSAITVAAATEERHRIARDMHDTLAKSLQSMNLTASVLPRLIESNPDRASQHARDLQETSVAAIDEVRALMSALRREVEEGPLHEVVEQVATDWSERHGVWHALTIKGDGVISDGLVRYELLMVLAESLENIARHAHAQKVWIGVTTTSERVTLTVRDNGVGAAPGRLEEATAERHYGVQGMRERLHKVGGTLTWVSTPGAGTTVTATCHPAGLIEQATPTTTTLTAIGKEGA